MTTETPFDSALTSNIVVYAYTREQALADGVLTDVSELASAMGYTVPVAVTLGVKALCTPLTEGQTFAGRLQVILTAASKIQSDDLDRAEFKVRLDGRTHDLWLSCDLEESGTPVLTIFFKHED